VADSRRPRDGKAIEEIGWYNPTEDPQRVEYDKERLEYWKNCGAQLTSAVERLIRGEYQYVPYEGSEAESEGAPKAEAEAVEEGREAEESTEAQEEKAEPNKGPDETD